ncbi:MAG: redoxin domain-containing protein [Candidatus Shikimatogenerans sp. JK-2022]|nr:redoxin domain-containing protein [Candidatus Shikimatogenerans bostrichidophilus]
MYNLINKKSYNFISNVIKNKIIIKKFNFKKYIYNKYCILFFLPKILKNLYYNELLNIINYQYEFKIRNIKILCINTYNLNYQLKFLKQIKKKKKIKNINYIFIYDKKKKISYKYNILSKKKFKNKKKKIYYNKTIIFIDKKFKIRYININNINIKINLNEILRIIDNFQYFKKNKKLFF